MKKRLKRAPQAPAVSLPETIDILVEERTRTVSTEAYCRAVLRSLRESYPGLTEEGVRQQLSLILAGQKLSVIGMIMKDEVVLGKA